MRPSCRRRCCGRQVNPRRILTLQTSVEAYGAFVNVGAKNDGLVHVSQLAVSVGMGSTGMRQCSCAKARTSSQPCS
jgi:hypothetical protein